MKRKFIVGLIATLAMMVLACGTALAGTSPKCPSCGAHNMELLGAMVSSCVWGCNQQTCSKRGIGQFIRHSMTSATCTLPPTCIYCDIALGKALGHNWGAWVKDAGADTHTRTCTRDASHTETESCSGGTATCTQKAVCTVCGGAYGAVDLSNHDASGAAATCTTDKVCARAGCGVVLQNALGHDYEASVTKPTCTENGFTTYTCSRCSDRYSANTTPQKGHWYGEWSQSAEGAHVADCKRGCGHTSTVSCAAISVVINAGAAEAYTLTFCPICGDTDTGEQLLFVEGAKAEAVTGALPLGELILRRGVLSDGTQILSVAFECAGKLTQPTGVVKILLPAEEFEGYAFSLISENAEGALLSSIKEIGGKKYAVLVLDFGAEEKGEANPAMLLKLTLIAE